MAKEVSVIRPETLEKMFGEWLISLKRGDITVVESYPSSDRQRRLLNLIDNKSLQKKYLGNPKKLVWISLDLRVEPVLTIYDLENLILRQITFNTSYNFKKTDFKTAIQDFQNKTQKQVIIVLTAAEQIIKRQQSAILTWVSSLFRQQIAKTLLFFECNLLKIGAPSARICLPNLYLYKK